MGSLGAGCALDSRGLGVVGLLGDSSAGLWMGVESCAESLLVEWLGDLGWRGDMEGAILASSSSWAWRGGGLVGHEFAGGACIEGLGSMGLVVRGTCHGLLCVGSRGWGSWLGLVAVSSGLDGDGVLGEASGGLVVECACPYGAVGPVDAGFGACGSLGLE